MITCWSWNPKPREVAAFPNVSIKPMVRGRYTFENVGAMDMAVAIEDGRAYADMLAVKSMLGAGRDQEEVVYCLQHFADHPGEEIDNDEVFPYWAAAAHGLVGRLKELAVLGEAKWPAAFVIHSEDRVVSRELRDERLGILLGRPLATSFPEVPVTGYGVRDTPHMLGSVSSYGGPMHVYENRSRGFGAFSETVTPGPFYYWIPGAGFTRKASKIFDERHRTVTAADVAMYARTAVLDESGYAGAIILWQNENGPSGSVEAWLETMRGLELVGQSLAAGGEA